MDIADPATDFPVRRTWEVPVPTAFPRRPILVGSEIYRHSVYGRTHPLSIQRVTPAVDLVRALGWLQDDRYVDSPRATPEQIARFHDPDYIAAVIEAERSRQVPVEVQVDDFQRWQRQNLRGHRPETRLIGSWGYRQR